MARRPFGPVRAKIWDAARAAESRIHTSSNQAEKSMAELTAKGLELMATVADFVDEATDGTVKITAKTPWFEIPIEIKLEWNSHEDERKPVAE